MKRKDKGITILGLSILMCSLFLVAIPATAIAAEQDDYVLGIYGNANEDDTIDMRDLTYVKLIFFGKKPETELADAKYDGKINPLDFIQIKLIIVGKEKELTVACAKTQNLPNDGTVVTIHKPVKRIIHLIPSELEAIRAIGAKDKVVGVCSFVSTEDEIFLPELIKLPCVGIFSSPDHEKILELKPDIVFTFPGWNPEFEDKLPGITVVRLSKFSDKMLEVKKLGYILDKKDEDEEFLDWCEGYINKIKSRTERHSEDEKPRVYLSWGTAGEGVSGKNTELDKPCTIAGGINIAGDFEGSFKIDPEWVIEQNPDIIYNSHWYISSGYAEDDPAEMKKYRGNIMSNPGWENIKAVKRGRVHIMTWKISVGHGPLMTAYMARWFHPDLFEDLDPEAIHQEYLTRFQGLDYDLDEHGVFVYPPIEIDGGLAGIPERYNGQI